MSDWPESLQIAGTVSSDVSLLLTDTVNGADD